MLKKHMAACLVATAFAAAPALAQTSTAPATTAPATTAPATTAPATTAPMSTTGASGSMSGQFMAMPERDHFRASKVIGVDIYGSNNERIGEVNEILLDRQGNVDALVIGVGGFLGIGEKNVAVPFKSVEWRWDRDAATSAARPAGAGTGTATTGTTATAPAANPPAGGTAPTATGTTAANTYREAPERGMVRMTKAELEAAPRFAYNPDGANRATTAPATAPATAPKQ
jgi:sporulation protein YlmC with PRC-barrel domain